MAGDDAKRRTYALPGRVLAGLYLLLGLTPLAIAVISGSEPENHWRELSAGLAMSALAIIQMQFLTSGRFPYVSGRAGIDVTMRFHQLAARTAFVFVIVHPFLYVVPRVLSGRGGALAMAQALFSSGRLRTGVAAWVLMIAVTLMAIWRDRLPLTYKTWRLTHGLGAGAIALLSLHHATTAGSYSANLLAAVFWIAMTILAAGSLANVYVLRPFMRLQHPYRVQNIERAAEKTWRVVIAPERGHSFDFAAGQFVWLNIGHSPFSLEENPFSISSSPAMRPQIEFLIKESGDFTSQIGNIKCGAKAFIDGPHGHFVLPDMIDRPVILIAGGVGIAPILSILRELHDRKFRLPITLIYGNRLESQIVARAEIDSMRERLDMKVFHVIGEPHTGWQGLRGDLSAENIQRCLGDQPQRAIYFICGPPPMMNSVERTLLSLGVGAGQIIAERFKYD